MKKISLYLKLEQIAKLKKHREKTGVPVSEVIRRAIDKYLHQV